MTEGSARQDPEGLKVRNTSGHRHHLRESRSGDQWAGPCREWSALRPQLEAVGNRAAGNREVPARAELHNRCQRFDARSAAQPQRVAGVRGDFAQVRRSIGGRCDAVVDDGAKLVQGPCGGIADLPHVRVIYQRAHDRGEINLERIPPAVLAVPFDLLRHDMLMALEPLKPARILSIVDELFLPLLRVYQAG